MLHLIDTPGHVDFGYEVSRSLAACEGAVLLVDASQGIQAQTLANCYQAIEHDLEIVAVLNKIDLPAADPERCAEEIEQVLGLPAAAILRISAKTGEGVGELLDAVIDRVPPPTGDRTAAAARPHLRLLLRPVPGGGELDPGGRRDPRDRPPACASCRPGPSHDVEEIGVRTPDRVPVDELGPGEVGYLIAGIKDVGEARSGETVTDAAAPGRRAPGRLPRPQADGLLRDLSRSTATSCPSCATRSTS